MSSEENNRIGGIVLCGGKSTRMGTPKWSLPFGDEILLQRTVRILSEVVSPVIVVAADDQPITGLDSSTQIVRDKFPEKGPLAGIHAGLEALQKHDLEAAYVTACDVPLLKPEFVKAIVDELGDAELAVAREGKFHHPLAGVYRLSLVSRIHTLLEADRLRPLFLIQESKSREIDVNRLRQVDRQLDSLKNCNTPEEYAAALTLAGLKETDGVS